MATIIPLHFAHGNGFPSESYQELFDHLAPEFQVSYIPMVGHGNCPVTQNWGHLVDELIEDIKKHHHAPIVGLGHSMGGVLMFMAACLQPQLFRQIVLLDSPVPGLWRSWFLKMVKRCDLIHHFTPIERARTRRVLFSHFEEAYDYFRNKPLFKNFTRKSLEYYIHYGLIETEHGYVLRFDREIETQLYATIPDNLYLYQKPPHLSASLIYSIYSELMNRFELAAMKNRYGFELYPFHRGTHLFPFEYPEAAANEIKRVVANIVNPH